MLGAFIIQLFVVRFIHSFRFAVPSPATIIAAMNGLRHLIKAPITRPWPNPEGFYSGVDSNVREAQN